MWMGIEPVYVAGLNAKELMSAIKKVLTAGHPRLPNPTREEMADKRQRSRYWGTTKARPVGKGRLGFGTRVALRLTTGGGWDLDRRRIKKVGIGSGGLGLGKEARIGKVGNSPKRLAYFSPRNAGFAKEDSIRAGPFPWEGTGSGVRRPRGRWLGGGLG